jgi:hypothetical protein
MESLVMKPNSDFWRGKRVLLTGHTGFKGAWLMWWLHHMGAQVTGLAQSPLTQQNLFELLQGKDLCDSHLIDLTDLDAVQKLMRQCKPDIVFHLAAQAIVRTAYEQPVSTFATNVLGTVHLLEAMRRPRKVSMVLKKKRPPKKILQSINCLVQTSNGRLKCVTIQNLTKVATYQLKVIDSIEGDQTSWEGSPLETIASIGQLESFEHRDFWQPMDTLRDKNHLEELWTSGKAPWKMWE